MSYNSQTELLQSADCQQVEQATTGRRGGTVNRHVQLQAGSTLARYGHSKLTGCTSPINHKYQETPHSCRHLSDNFSQRQILPIFYNKPGYVSQITPFRGGDPGPHLPLPVKQRWLTFSSPNPTRPTNQQTDPTLSITQTHPTHSLNSQAN